MKIVRKSYFKQSKANLAFLHQWIKKLEQNNGYQYDKIQITTSLGTTQLYGFNTTKVALETIVIFPGFRTTALLWDLDKGLQELAKSYRVFMVETNGQPNLSDGNSPDIKSLAYGHWCNEIFYTLNIKKAFLIGASFGGLICMKFALTNPEKIKAAFLLNAACWQSFSLAPNNLYYNLLPVIFPSEQTIAKFIDNIIGLPPNNSLSRTANVLLRDYLIFALQYFKNKAQVPYAMGQELRRVSIDTYLIQGKMDLLFPYRRSIRNAKKYLSQLKEIKVFDKVGHGIELYPPALQHVKKVMDNYQN